MSFYNSNTSEWCDVIYCEDGIRYGSEYRTPHKIFRINGYTNPNYDPNVFRLGSIVRSLHDKPRSSEVTKQINNGLQLNLIGSEVIVTNLSTNDIYVAAMDAKMVNAIPIAHVLVRKLATGEQISVFDYVNFTKVLGHNVNYGTEAVQKISDYCYIKVSFKNDFTYDRGLSGLQAPCWVQIKLHSPREWLDRVLKAMPPIKPETSIHALGTTD
ncbi:mothers against decapentaplegic homolog 5-like [Nasonia vitripennis]|uniref:MH2 domain-containing protein n=1 Tax=Nasonia vitripennis TaxID=7425 RepID=A0A7M7GBQ9_NASVI|nr:mothers against decapentaplegic homolog 5-like [Nasonia vitripennis]